MIVYKKNDRTGQVWRSRLDGRLFVILRPATWEVKGGGYFVHDVLTLDNAVEGVDTDACVVVIESTRVSDWLEIYYERIS